MKTIKFGILISIITITVIGTSCTENLNGVADENLDIEKSMDIAGLLGDSCTFSGTLSESEIEGLMVMREEEKLAHDVYMYFFETYNHKIFNNISSSESMHTNAILYLINGFGLTDPTPDVVGEFNNPLFSDLYVQLTTKGAAGLTEALKAGAFIEETDIVDLENIIATSENEDVIRVYSHLLAGTKIHLKAFINILTQYGEIYEPVVLTEDAFQSILNETVTRGKNGYQLNNSTSKNNNGNGFGPNNGGNGNGKNRGNGKGKNS